MKRKYTSILFVFIMCALAILGVACNKYSKEKENVPDVSRVEKIKIATLKGPTGLGAVKLMEDKKDSYNITVYDSPDQLVGKVINGEVDAAMVPSNMASVLYNKTNGEVEFVAINTLGVLYIVENGNSVQDIKNIKGKTLYSTGKGTVPEYVLKYILKNNNIDPEKDVNIQYKGTHTELATAVASKEVDLAMLPEPFVTIAKSKDKDLNVPIDLSKEWEKVSEGKSKLVMGTLIFRKDFIEKRPTDLKRFVEDYKNSIKFTNENLKEAGELAEKYGIIPNAKIAEDAIPKCNIVFIDGKEGENAMEGFLKVLMEYNPKTIGGKLPDANFYYKTK